jgi:hypothetical protein
LPSWFVLDWRGDPLYNGLLHGAETVGGFQRGTLREGGCLIPRVETKIFVFAFSRNFRENFLAKMCENSENFRENFRESFRENVKSGIFPHN